LDFWLHLYNLGNDGYIAAPETHCNIPLREEEIDTQNQETIVDELRSCTPHTSLLQPKICIYVYTGSSSETDFYNYHFSLWCFY